jgi:hypothetical protein
MKRETDEAMRNRNKAFASRIAPLGSWRPGTASPARRAWLGLPAWAAWAAALARRHAPIHLPGARAALRLRRAAAGVSGERWRLLTLHLHPTVRLSVAPMLRQDYWPSSSAAGRPRPHGPARGSDPGAGGQAGGPGQRSSAPAPALSHPAPAGPPARDLRDLVPALPPPGPAPLDLVLRRLREPAGGRRPRPTSAAYPAGGDAGPGDHDRFAGGDPSSVGTGLAREMAARLRRRELAPAESPPALRLGTAAGQPRAGSSAGSSAGRAGRGGGGAAAGASGAAPWDEAPPPAGWGEPSFPPRRRAAAAAPFSPELPTVEALAERVMQQIDRRLGAWRERTGAF